MCKKEKSFPLLLAETTTKYRSPDTGSTDCLSLCLKLLQALSLKLGTALLKLGLGLKTHGTITPLALNVLVELSMEGLSQLLQLGLIILVDLGQGNDGGGLEVSQGTQTSLSLDNGEWDVHLSAKGRKPEDQLDGVNVVSDDDQLGLLLLDEGSHVLQTELKGGGRGSRGGVLGSSGGLQALQLGLLVLRLVLDEKLEQLSSLVLVQGAAELVDGRGHLQSLKKDLMELRIKGNNPKRKH